MLCFEAASCHCYTIREGEWASHRRKARYGQKGENKAQKKLDREELEKKGDNSTASLRGVLI